MTYTFKLSRRLAQSWAVTVLVACSLTLSCATGDGPSGPDASPGRIVVFPHSIILGIDQTAQFVVDPDTSVVWTATGGTMDAAGRYTAGSVTGDFQVIATASNGPADTAAVTVTAVAPVLSRVVLTPASASVPTGSSKQFVAVGNSADGTTVSVAPIYSATGGNVSSAGVYYAGGTPGSYQVVVADSATGLADTAAMTVTSPASTLRAVVLAPTIISLTLGGSQQFTATGTKSDEVSGPVAVTWLATGGTISSAGLYTAGQTAGSFRVIATQTAGTLADTSAIVIIAPPSAPAPGMPIFPGQSIQAAVDANPPGTAFLLKAGRHFRQSVVPKSRDVFRCEAGAVLDGQNATAYAFKGVTGIDSVRIAGCTITAYNPPLQMGAILVTGYDTLGGKAWTIDSNDVGYNANGGIRTGARTAVRWNNVHHNGQTGITGTGDDLLIEGNEIAFNNPTAAGLGFEAGGTKFAFTNGLVLRGNYVHDNQGPGLWTDIDNDRYVIEGNRVEDNLQDGIVTEISYSGVIRNNTVRRNGLRDSRRLSWLWGAGIGIHASAKVEVYGNTLEGNAHGIALVQQNRGSGRLGAHLVQDANVHDNTIRCGAGTLTVAGAAQDVGSTAIFTSRNNRFVNNTYMLTGCGGSPFAWMNGYRTQTEWKSYAQDVTSKFVR